MKVSANCIELVKHYEGCKLTAYQDSVGVWTIGFGHTEGVEEGDVCTQEQAEFWLLEELTKFGNQINGLNLAINQNQFDALCSFAYNLGFGNLQKSTLLKLIRKDANNPLIGQEFYKWVRAGGVILRGLQHRRLSEYHLYATGTLKFNWL